MHPFFCSRFQIYGQIFVRVLTGLLRAYIFRSSDTPSGRERESGMCSVTRFCEKVYVMAEGGSHYCSKKTDDVCDEVNILSSFFYILFLINVLMS